MKISNFTKSMQFGIIITIIGASCWGISGCFGQYLFQEKAVTAEWLVAIRLVAAGSLLLLIGFFKDGKKRYTEVNYIFIRRNVSMPIYIFCCNSVF